MSDEGVQRHHHLVHHRHRRPALTTDEHVGFNGRLGAAITRTVGSMWAFYLAAAFMALWMGLSEVGVLDFDPYPFAFLLFLGNVAQLLLMFVIMVGQQVLGAASDKRALQTFDDAEALLTEVEELRMHLRSQEATLATILSRLDAQASAP